MLGLTPSPSHPIFLEIYSSEAYNSHFFQETCMSLSIPSDSSLFLQLASKYLIEVGIYGRITNLKTIKSISLVCKQWQTWIYSEEGPFRPLGDQISVLRQQKTPCGPIHKFNQLLTEQGRVWFLYVHKYKPTSPAPLPRNTDAINYISESGATPLKIAIDLSLKNNEYVPLISQLIQCGADPSLPTSSSKNALNHYEYVFSDRFWDDSKFENLKKIALSLGAGFIQGDSKGENLFHSIDLFDEMRWKTFYSWYSSLGADVNQLSKQKQTPLHKALIRVHGSQILSLIEAGASLDIPTSEGDFPIHIIVKKWRTPSKDHYSDILIKFLNKSPDQVYLLDGKGHTPLWWAIRKGSLPFRDQLLEHMSPSSLHLKSDYFLPYTEFLAEDWIRSWGLHANRYPKGYNITNMPSLYEPCDCTQPVKPEYLKTLLEELDLLLNLLAPSPEIKQELLQKNLDEDGNTFFHLLARSHPPLMEHLYSTGYLLQGFKDCPILKGDMVIDIYRKQQNTLGLINACQLGDLNVVESLLKKPVNLHVNDIYGNNLLHLVVTRALNQHKSEEEIEAYYEILKLLLDQGIDPNACNTHGEVPLHFTFYLNHSESPFNTLLLDYGAKTSVAKDVRGKTPLESIREHSDKAALISAFENT